MRKGVVGRWRVGGGLQVLLGFWCLQLECTRVLHEVARWLNEGIGEGVLRWFVHVQRMLRGSMWEGVPAIVQWVGYGKGRLAP